MKTFAERLRSLRGETGSKEFAALIGISSGALSAYENGKGVPKIKTISQISERLGIDEDWLIFGMESERKPSVKTTDGGGFERDKCIQPIENIESQKIKTADVGGSDKTALEPKRLRDAIEVVEEGLKTTGRTMTPGQKAELVVAVYDLLSGNEGVESAAILRLIQAVV